MKTTQWLICLALAAAAGCTEEDVSVRGIGGDGQARLYWNSAGRTLKCSVQRSDTPGGPYTTVATGLTASEYSEQSLVNGRRYYYVVSAAGGAVKSREISVVTCAPPVTGEEWDLTTTMPITSANPPEKEAWWGLWVPKTAAKVRGILAISQHGSGKQLSVCPELRNLAADLDCAVLALRGSVQRGLPRPGLMQETLKQFAGQCGHPELIQAPMILFGHSNGTGFSAGFAAAEPDRVIAWIAFKSAAGSQFSRPAIYGIPGLVISGEDDKDYFRDQLVTVEKLRRENSALMNMVVEPKVGHMANPQDQMKSFSIVLAFMKEAYLRSIPAGGDAATIRLIRPKEKDGWLGQNWDRSVGGFQLLTSAPFARFEGDRQRASWLLSESYARQWQEFMQTGSVQRWW